MLVSTCQGRSQSRGIGHAPTHAPIAAPWAGRQIDNSNAPLGLNKVQVDIFSFKKHCVQTPYSM